MGGFNWLISLNSMDTKDHYRRGPSRSQEPYGSGYSFLTVDVRRTAALWSHQLALDAGCHRGEDDGGDQVFFVRAWDGGLEPSHLHERQGDPGAPIVLPAPWGARFSDVTISADNNCIGDINQAWYASGACQDIALDTCPKWYTAGAFGGYITLQDAQNVEIVAIGVSLCSVLVYGLTGSACTPSTSPTAATTAPRPRKVAPGGTASGWRRALQPTRLGSATRALRHAVSRRNGAVKGGAPCSVPRVP